MTSTSNAENLHKETLQSLSAHMQTFDNFCNNEEN